MLEVDAPRVAADLKALDRLTGGPDGARRIAWTPTWDVAREFVTGLCAELGLEPRSDAAGNLWWTLPGATTQSAQHLIVGSHVDSVPAGGWLDGVLGVLAGVEVLRAAHRSGAELPPISLVDWADEEGARFSVSLFGSSLVMGELDGDSVAEMTDADGVALRDVVTPYGVQLTGGIELPEPLSNGAAYLELHIEQGPVLERAELPIAAVSGTCGIERDMFVITGQAAHAGTTPMNQRNDAFLVAAELALGVERIATAQEGVGTTGRVELAPGIATAVAGQVTIWTDLRHLDGVSLNRMRAETAEVAERAASQRGCTVTRERVFSIEPRPFDPWLVEAARAACADHGGADYAIPSGALHDAAVVAAKVPTTMLFCASKAGLSHCAQEDTAEADIELAVTAFADLAERALRRGHCSRVPRSSRSPQALSPPPHMWVTLTTVEVVNVTHSGVASWVQFDLPGRQNCTQVHPAAADVFMADC